MVVRSILIVPYVFSLILCLFGIIDVKRRPDWAWRASGQDRTRWLVLNILGFVFGIALFSGLIIGLIYVFAIRPKVAEAQKGAGPMGGVGYGGGEYGSVGSPPPPPRPTGSA